MSGLEFIRDVHAGQNIFKNLLHFNSGFLKTQINQFFCFSHEAVPANLVIWI